MQQMLIAGGPWSWGTRTAERDREKNHIEGRHHALERRNNPFDAVV
jgi:hypothetical protein